MDEEGSTGSQDDTVKLKDKSKLVDEAIREGINKASDTSFQSHEDTVFQFALVDSGRFQNNKHRRQAIKEQIIRFKTKKIEDDFYKWNKEFLELNWCLGIKAYMCGEKQYPSTREILGDTLADGNKEKNVNEVVSWLHKDAFGRVFLTLPDTKSMEILHSAEIFRLEGSCAHMKYYNKALDSIVTRKGSIFDTYDQICEHYLKLTGTSMMTLVVKLVNLSRFDATDKFCAKGITSLRELRESVQRNLLFPEIPYIAVFLMMMEKESVVKDKITLMVNEKYMEIFLEEVIFTYTSYARDLELSEETENALSGKRSKAGKAKVKRKEFEKFKQDGKCYKCFKEGSDVKY